MDARTKQFLLVALSSDQPGEVANAIKLFKKGMGCDAHAIAAKLDGPTLSNTSERARLRDSVELQAANAMVQILRGDLTKKQTEVTNLMQGLQRCAETVRKLTAELEAERRKRHPAAAPETMSPDEVLRRMTRVPPREMNWRQRAQILLDNYEASMPRRESDFLRSILSRNYANLTDRQHEWLMDIWTKFEG